MNKKIGDIYKVGCAHCGKLVHQFPIGDKSIAEEIKNMPEHKCPIKGT